jgi:ElaB/YqjD/DUF883 family membrane-anchored ribosome-binding protein
MNTHVRETAKATAKDAREGARDIHDATAEASGNIEGDLKALRDDFGRLADQVGSIVSDKGAAAWRRARSGVDDAVSDAQDKGREALGAVSDVSDNLVDAIDESIKKRPYATLALVAGLGFLFGATWRR